MSHPWLAVSFQLRHEVSGILSIQSHFNVGYPVSTSWGLVSSKWGFESQNAWLLTWIRQQWIRQQWRLYINARLSFDDYLKCGLQNAMVTKDLDTCLRELAARHGLHDSLGLKHLVNALTKRVGHPTSLTHLGQVLNQSVHDNENTVFKYVNTLLRARVLLMVPNFNDAITGLTTPPKYYVGDHVFLNGL